MLVRPESILRLTTPQNYISTRKDDKTKTKQNLQTNDFFHLNYYKNGEFLNCMQIISLIVIFPYNPIDQIRIGICLFF